MWWSCALVLSYLHLQATTPSVDAHPLTDWQQPPRNPPGLIYLHQNYHYKPSSQQKQNEDALEPFLQYRLKQLKILDSADDAAGNLIKYHFVNVYFVLNNILRPEYVK